MATPEQCWYTKRYFRQSLDLSTSSCWLSYYVFSKLVQIPTHVRWNILSDWRNVTKSLSRKNSKTTQLDCTTRNQIWYIGIMRMGNNVSSCTSHCMINILFQRLGWPRFFYNLQTVKTETYMACIQTGTRHNKTQSVTDTSCNFYCYN